MTMRAVSVSGRRGLLLLLLSLPILTRADLDQRETVHDDPFVAYPYRLSSNSPFGRIPDSALPGSEVLVDTTLLHFHDNRDEFLRLHLYRNGLSPQSNVTTVSQLVSVTERIPSLPEKLKIDVSEEHGNVASVDEDLAFAIDEGLAIVVDKNDNFYEVDQIAFWVVTIQREKGKPDMIVSNPLAFVVMIDHSEPEGEGAVVYVGIIVLVVCLFALLIPLTVRTKRRLREGKPLCACGSSGRKLEERTREREGEEGGKGKKELASISGGEVALAEIYEGRPVAATVHDPEHETIQSHRMRSVSNPHFLPKLLDSHYKDVYVHPDYQHQQKQQQRRQSASSPPASQPTFPVSPFPSDPPLFASVGQAPAGPSAKQVTVTTRATVHQGGGGARGQGGGGDAAVVAAAVAEDAPEPQTAVKFRL